MHSHSPLVMPSTGYVSPSNAQAIETPHSASFHANPPSDAGDTADEAAIVAEDKRRRNTSASGVLFPGSRSILALNVDSRCSQVSDQKEAEITQPRANRRRLDRPDRGIRERGIKLATRE